MTEPSPQQIERATRAFLLALRREWLKLRPVRVGECPVPVFEELEPNDRAFFTRAMKVAVIAGVQPVPLTERE